MTEILVGCRRRSESVGGDGGLNKDLPASQEYGIGGTVWSTYTKMINHINAWVQSSTSGMLTVMFPPVMLSKRVTLRYPPVLTLAEPLKHVYPSCKCWPKESIATGDKRALETYCKRARAI